MKNLLKFILLIIILTTNTYNKTIASDQTSNKHTIEAIMQINQLIQDANFITAEAKCRNTLKDVNELFGEQSQQSAIIINWMIFCMSINGNLLDSTTAQTAEKAITILEPFCGKDSIQTSERYINLGTLYENSRQFEDAKRCFEKSLNIFKNILPPNDLRLAEILNHLGNNANRLSTYTRARDFFCRSLLISKNINNGFNGYVASSYNGLAIIEDDLYNYPKAEYYLKQVIKINDSILSKSDFTKAITLSHLSINLIMQEKYDSAKIYLIKADTIAMLNRIAGYKSPIISQIKHQLGMVMGYTDSTKERYYQEALDIIKEDFGTLNVEYVRRLEDLGIVQASQFKFSESIRTHETAINILIELEDELSPSLLASFYKYAGSLRMMGFTERAYKIANQAIKIAETNYKNISSHLSEKESLGITNRWRESLNMCISCWSDLNSEKEKYSLELMNKIFAFKGITTELMLKRKLLSRENNNLIDFSKLIKIKEFVEPTWEDIQIKLPINTVLLEFYRYTYRELENSNESDKYIVIVLSSEGLPHLIELGDADIIDFYIERYTKHFQQIAILDKKYHPVSLQSYIDSVGDDIYTNLWKPLEPYLENASPIFIAPDGQLNLISFATLIDSSNKFLIERYPMHYISTGRDLLRSKQHSKVNSSLLAIGYPNFNATVSQRKNSSPINNQDLKNTLKEDQYSTLSSCGNPYSLNVRILKNGKPAFKNIFRDFSKKSIHNRMLVGDSASEDNFKLFCKNRQIIYFYTHGYFFNSSCNKSQEQQYSFPFSMDSKLNDNNPLVLSGLLLAGSNIHDENIIGTNIDDGVLTSLEVSTLDLTGTQLVVLGACETGLGEINNGEGVFGLRRAFLLAGAQTIVSSLWEVDATTTTSLMNFLLKRTETSETVYEKMQKAQLALIKKVQTNNNFSDHPYYWGAFIPTGEW